MANNCCTKPVLFSHTAHLQKQSLTTLTTENNFTLWLHTLCQCFIYIPPRGGFPTNHISRHPPGYTLLAPPLAGSPCYHWYNLYIINRTIISLQIKSFTIVRIQNFCNYFWGLNLQQISTFFNAPSWIPKGQLTALPIASTLWGGGSLFSSLTTSPLSWTLWDEAPPPPSLWLTPP